MKKSPRIIYLILFVYLLFSSFPASHSRRVFAQTSSTWSPQERIPGYGNNTSPPRLIADQNQTIHAFASQQVGENGDELAIIYNKWTLDGGWTDPVDILLSPIRRAARLLGAFLDKTGMFHIIFFGGDETGANIYYSKAPAINAGKATAWSSPVLVGEQALNPENGVISGDDKGNLVIVFSGQRDGNGLYVIYSNNGGDTWSNQESFFLTNDDQLFPFDSRMCLGLSGKLYTVWSLYDRTGAGVSIYYSKLEIGDKKWSEPLQLASGVGLGVSLPDVIEYQGNVIVTYYDFIANNALWMVQSSDEGQNWTEPIRIAPDHIGRNGAVSSVIDSNNVLHLLFGERMPLNPDIHGMWHTTWQNGYFSQVEAVVSGPLVRDPIGYESFDPYGARAAIVQGNTLLVTWRTDPGSQSKSNGVWYSYVSLNAPELPISPLPVPQLSTNVAPTQIISGSMPTPTQLFNLALSDQKGNLTSGDSSSLNDPAFPIIIALIPTTILTLLVIVIYYLRHHNR